MKKLYICHTIYHLLISIIKVLNSNDDSTIIITTRIKDAIIYKNRLEELCSITVIVVNDYDFKKNNIFYNDDNFSLFECMFNNSEIYIFNDFTFIGYYLHKNKLEYNLLEDGYNCLKYPISIAPNSFKDKIKNFITNTPRYYGFSKYCKTIEVNDINGLPKDSRLGKYRQQSKQELFNNLSVENKNIILNIFDVQKIKIKTPAVLILTQPLENVGYSEEERYNFYKKVLEEYSSKFNIYIKVHPRDEVDYTNLNVNIVSKSIPAELLDFVVDNKFEIGITYFSTALESLGCIKNKVYLSNQER